MTSPSDEAVMRAIQGAHPEMLAILFERHYDRAFAVCFGMTGDRSLAEDLVQEAFMRVLRYAHTFEARSSFGSWFLRIARNVCHDHFESARRERDALGALAAEQPTQKASSPERDRLRLLRVALDRLSPDQREVLVLSRLQGLRYAEIAEVCGAKEGTVRVRAHRALKELRKIVESMEAAR